MATERYIIEISTRGVGRSQKQLQALGVTAQRTTKFLGFLRAALVVFASIAILNAFSQYADALTRMSNKMRLVTKNTSELNSVMGELFNISQRTRTSFEANVDLFTKVARSTSTMKLTFAELLEVTEAVAIATKISGEEASTAANGLRQFGQALASGTLNGDELRSVTENLARLASALATEFGVTGAQLRKFGKDNPGMLTNIRLVKALIEQFPQLREELGLTKITIQDAFVRFNNQLQVFIGKLSSSLGLAQKVDDVLQFIAVHLVQITIALLALAGITAFNFVVSQVILLEARLFALLALITSVFTSMLKLLGLVLLPWRALHVSLVLVGAAANALFFIIPLLGAMRAAVLGLVVATRAWLITARTATIATTAFGVAASILVIPLRAVAFGLGLIAAATLANPLFLIGAVVVAGLVTAFIAFKDTIDATLVSMGGFKGIMDIVLAAVIATAITIAEAWDKLPAVVKDASVRMANEYIETQNEITDTLNQGSDNITGFLDKVIAATAAVLVGLVRLYEKAVDEFVGFFQKGYNKIIRGSNLIGEAAKAIINLFPGDDVDFVPFGEVDVTKAKTLAEIVDDMFQSYTDILNTMKSTDTLFESFDRLDLITNENAGALEEFRAQWTETFNRILEEGPTDQLIAKLKDLKEFLSGALGFEIDPKDLFELPNIQGQGEITKQIENLSKSMASLLASISPFAAGMLKMKAAQDLVAEASMKGIDLFDRYGVSAAEVIRRVQRDMVGAGNAVTDYVENLTLLEKALQDTSINQAEYNKLARELRIELLENQTGALAGMELGLLKVGATAEDAGTQISDAIVGAFQQATEAFLDLLTRLAFQKSVVASLTNLLGSVIPGSASVSSTSNLSTDIAKGVSPSDASGTPFAHGGAFTVGQSSSVGTVSGAGVDNRLIAFRARDGERVEVTPPGEAAEQSRKATLNLVQNFNINNPVDPDGFGLAQPQIAARGLTAAERFRQRIGG
jgi:tape measure domain-containing protein